MNLMMLAWRAGALHPPWLSRATRLRARLMRRRGPTLATLGACEHALPTRAFPTAALHSEHARTTRNQRNFPRILRYIYPWRWSNTAMGLVFDRPRAVCLNFLKFASFRFFLMTRTQKK